MRIGIEGQRLFRLEKHGMDIVAIELIKHLQLIDKVNQYFIFVKEGVDDDWYTPTENFHLIRIKKKPYHIWEQILLPREVIRYKIELLHCTSNTAPIWLKTPLVLTLHDIIYLENLRFVSFQSTAYQLAGNFYRRWVVPSVLKSAKRIITVSNTEKEIILNSYPNLKTKLSVIYNAMPDSFLNIDKSRYNNVREKYKLPEEYIFTLGNASPKKNMPNVLKAYVIYHQKEKLPLPLILADEPPKDVFNLLSAQIPKEVEKDIHFIGYVKNNDIPYLYALSRVFIYASLRESFGIPILEAMAAGVPVITSKDSCMPEIAQNAAAFVDPKNPEDIANTLHSVLSDKNLTDRLVENGNKRFVEFTWLNSAKKVLDIYSLLYEEVKDRKPNRIMRKLELLLIKPSEEK